MPDENPRIVREIYEAFKRRDLPAVMAMISPDAEYFQSDTVPWGGHYRGHDGMAYIDHPRMLAALRL